MLAWSTVAGRFLGGREADEPEANGESRGLRGRYINKQTAKVYPFAERELVITPSSTTRYCRKQCISNKELQIHGAWSIGFVVLEFVRKILEKRILFEVCRQALPRCPLRIHHTQA